MKIRIIKETPKGSGNKTWKKGTELNVSNRYAERLVKEGYAQYVKDTDAEIWAAMLGDKLKQAKEEEKPKRKRSLWKKDKPETVKPTANNEEE